MLAAVLFLLLAAAIPLRGQITQVTANLKNRWLQDRRGPVAASLIEKSYEQFYDLGFRGYVYNRKLLIFDVKTSYNDLNTDYGISPAVDTRKRSDFGYYDASATLFPENGFKLRAFARQNRIDYQNNGLIDIESGNAYSTVQNNRLYGVSMFIPRNTYYPNIDMSMQRNLQKCEEPCTEVYSREDIARVILKNSSSNGSSYNAEYRGRYRDDYSEGWSSKEHQIRFKGRSRISDVMNVNATGMLFLRDAHSNRNINLFADYDQSKTVRHRFSAANTETRVSALTPNRSTRTTFDHKAFIDLSNTLRSVLGVNYEGQTLSIGGNARSGEKATVHGQMDYRSVTSDVSLNGTAVFDGGLERGIGLDRRFVQQTQLGGGAIFNLDHGSSILLHNNMFYENMSIGGSHFRNMVRFEANTAFIAALPLSVKATRTDAVFMGSSVLPGNAITTFEGYATWRPWYAISLMMHHSERFTSSTYNDRTSRSVATITIFNLIRNLDLRVQAEQSVSSLTGYKIQRIEGELGYRFYAFTFSAKYLRDAYGNYVRDRVLFEVRRPIDIRFR